MGPIMSSMRGDFFGKEVLIEHRTIENLPGRVR
jgi:hypothetical protein